MRKPIQTKSVKRVLTTQAPGGHVQSEKHTIVYDKERKATFKFREPKSSDWK